MDTKIVQQFANVYVFLSFEGFLVICVRFTGSI